MTDVAGSTTHTVSKRTRSSDEIVLKIRTSIISGEVRHGERLPNERDLCRQFGISRPTLREGLRVLEALGVVEIRPGAAGGIYASEPDGDQVGLALEALINFRRATAGELAEFRVSFEGETAAWAARRADEEDVIRLERIAATFVERARDEAIAWPELAQLDIAFHEALASASKNQVRVAVMLGIHRALYRASVSLDPLVSSSMRRAIGRELMGIAQAVRQRNVRLASTRTRRHVQKFSELELLTSSDA